jgi:hypothetical protein
MGRFFSMRGEEGKKRGGREKGRKKEEGGKFEFCNIMQCNV